MFLSLEAGLPPGGFYLLNVDCIFPFCPCSDLPTFMVFLMTCLSGHSGFEEVTYNDLSSACITLTLVVCPWRVFPGVGTCVFHSQTMRICMEYMWPLPHKSLPDVVWATLTRTEQIHWWPVMIRGLSKPISIFNWHWLVQKQHHISQ